MILGAEGVQAWTGADGSILALNRRDLWPHYEVRRIPGLHRGGDFEAQSDNATQRTGEVPREGERAGKSMTYEGLVKARSLPDLLSAVESFQAAFADTAEGTMVHSPHPDYPGADLPTRTLHCRVLEASVDDEQAVDPHRSSFGYERPFSLSVRLSDPRYYHDAETNDHSATVIVVGGTSFPFTPGDQLEPPSTQGVELVTTNDGSAPVDAVLMLQGPMRNPIVSNETTGHFLRFIDLNLPDDQHFLEIDFHARTVKRPGVNVNVHHKIDPASTWWDRGVSCLVPGANTLRVRAYTLAGGASLRATYYPADAA